MINTINMDDVLNLSDLFYTNLTDSESLYDRYNIKSLIKINKEKAHQILFDDNQKITKRFIFISLNSSEFPIFILLKPHIIEYHTNKLFIMFLVGYKNQNLIYLEDCVKSKLFSDIDNEILKLNPQLLYQLNWFPELLNDRRVCVHFSEKENE